MIFFRDPIAPSPHEPELAALLQLCDAQEIPIATNRATAEALIYFLLNSPDHGVVTARPWGLVLGVKRLGERMEYAEYGEYSERAAERREIALKAGA